MNLAKKVPGVVMFFINDSCNYRCSYCFTSSKIKYSDSRVKDYKLFLKQVKKSIPKGWCFFISGGGEPFLHPDLFYIIKNLVKSGYLISINTNFSPPLSDFKKFLKITGKHLICLRASLHLEYSRPEIFIEKILSLKKSFPYFNNYDVRSVALPEKMNYLKESYLKFKKAGIKFKLQPLKKEKNRKNKYSKKQQEIINLVNSYSSKIKSLIITGKKCHCGCDYFVLSPYGESFRCIPAMKNKKSKNGYLGNILKNSFSLHKQPMNCQEKSCFCLEKFTI